ncbi:MAG: DMT family transporter [Rhizobiales bacterium]|nr:DMT family transporter [Hyphomicrobiales bacterium]
MNRNMTARSPALAGIGLMLAGMFMFSFNDALGKWLLVTYSVGQMLLIRSIAGAAVLSPFILRAGAEPFRAAPRRGLQVLRVALATAEVVCFFVAVSYLPLADTVTFYLAGPVYVTALSALLLGEQVGWRRGSAVLVGFAGVLVALNPSAATLTWPALIALAGSIFYALLMIVTRHLRGTSDVVMAAGQVGGMLAFGLVMGPLAWTPLRGIDVALMALLGCVGMGALMCVNRSLKLAPASVVVPYQYTMIVWAVLFGYWGFGAVPKPNVIAGAAVIVAAGLYIFLREQAQGRIAPAPNPPA